MLKQCDCCTVVCTSSARLWPAVLAEDIRTHIESTLCHVCHGTRWHVLGSVRFGSVSSVRFGSVSSVPFVCAKNDPEERRGAVRGGLSALISFDSRVLGAGASAFRRHTVLLLAPFGVKRALPAV